MWAFRGIPLPVGWLRPHLPLLSAAFFSFFSILKVVYPVVTTATKAMEALMANDHQVRDDPGAFKESVA